MDMPHSTFDVEHTISVVSTVYFFLMAFIGSLAEWPSKAIYFITACLFMALLAAFKIIRINLPFTIYHSKKIYFQTKKFILKRFLEDVQEDQAKKAYENIPVSANNLFYSKNHDYTPPNARKIFRRILTNEVRVSLSDKRPNVKLDFPGGVSSLALLDSGSQSCIISEDLVAKIEQATGPLPRLDSRFSIKPYGNSPEIENVQAIVLDFKIGTREMTQVPFLISPKAKKEEVLIGSNFIRAKRMTFEYDSSEMYVSFANEPVRHKVYLDPDFNYACSSVHEISLPPMETKKVLLQIVDLNNLSNNNFNGKPIYISENKDCFEDLKISCLSKVHKGNKILAEITNTSKNDILLLRELEIANALLVPPEKTEKLVHLNDLIAIKDAFNKIPILQSTQCICDLMKYKNKSILAEFSPLGMTISNEPYLDRLNSIEETRKMEGLVLSGGGCNNWAFSKLFLFPKNGSYDDYDLAEMSEQLKRFEIPKDKQKLKVLIPEKLNLSLSKMRVLVLLSSLIDLELILVDKSFLHQSCATAALSLPTYLTNAPRTKIVFSKSALPGDRFLEKTNGPDFHFFVLNTRIDVFRDTDSLKILVHLTSNPTYDNYLPNLIITLLNQLKVAGCSPDMKIGIGSSSSQLKKEIHRSLIDSMKHLGKFKEKTRSPLSDAQHETFKLNTSIPCSCKVCCDKEHLNVTNFESIDLIFEGNINSLRHEKLDSSQSQNLKESSIIKVYESVLGLPSDLELDGYGVLDENVYDMWTQEYPSHMDFEIKDPVQVDWRKKIDVSQIPEVVRAEFIELMDEYSDVFTQDGIGVRYIKDYVFDLKTTLKEGEIIFNKPFEMSLLKVRSLDRIIQQLLDNNLISEIDSPHRSNCLLVPRSKETMRKLMKENAQEEQLTSPDLWRFCIDLRKLNSYSVFPENSSYLVRKIDTLSDKLVGKKFFISLDVSKAFKSCLASPETRKLMAFSSPFSEKFGDKVFAFYSVIEGSKLLPQWFSKLMVEVLPPSVKRQAIVFVDDCFLISETEKELLQTFRETLIAFRKYNLLIHLSKLKLFRQKGVFLGNYVDLTQDGALIDILNDRKKSAIEIPIPTNANEIMRLIGTAVYMYSHIDSFQLIIAPLLDTLKTKKRNISFPLKDIELKSVQELKKAIENAPSLYVADFTKTMIITADASIEGTGFCLANLTENGKRNIIKYGAKRFSLTEFLATSSVLKEALGVLAAAATFRYYLSNCYHVVIETDMQSIVAALSNLNNVEDTRMARLSHRLYALNCEWKLIHQPASNVQISDLISRSFRPYRAAFSLKANEMKKSNLNFPKEWTTTPNQYLTSEDILRGIADQIAMETSSATVFQKRFECFEKLANEFNNTHLADRSSMQKLREKFNPSQKVNCASVVLSESSSASLKKVSNPLKIDANTILADQMKDDKLSGIIHVFLTKSESAIPKSILQKYHLLSNNILVKRLSKKFDFDQASNVRIPISEKLALKVLAINHISSHIGINSAVHLFNQVYRSENVRQLATIISHCCKSCRLFGTSKASQLPQGMFPIARFPNDIWYVDHCVFRPVFIAGKKITCALVMVDGFSGLISAVLGTSQTSKSTIQGLSQMIAYLGPPKTLVSDNSTSFVNDHVREVMASYGIELVRTSSANRSESNSLAEYSIKRIRTLLRLNAETFKSKPLDLFYSSLMQINSRQIKNPKNLRMTPYSIHFGRPPVKTELEKLLDDMEPEDHDQYKAQVNEILNDFNSLKKAQYQEYLERVRLAQQKFKPGDLVLLRNTTRHKEDTQFFRNIFIIKSIESRKATLQPLFGKQKIIRHFLDHLKFYRGNQLLKSLPEEIRNLLGEGLTNEEILKMAKKKTFPNDLKSSISRPKRQTQTSNDHDEKSSYVSEFSSDSENEEEPDILPSSISEKDSNGSETKDIMPNDPVDQTDPVECKEDDQSSPAKCKKKVTFRDKNVENIKKYLAKEAKNSRLRPKRKPKKAQNPDFVYY